MQASAPAVSLLLLLAMLGHAQARYPQWVVKKGVAFPERLTEATPISPSSPVPDDCPIPKKAQKLFLARQGEFIVGGTMGVALFRKGVWHYFGAKRYLPDNRVEKLGVDSSGALFVKTSQGTAKITTQPMSLEEKAHFFLKRIKARHIRDGFVRFLSLKVPGDPEQGGFLTHYDNDGLWTSLYVQAEALRYAVTKDPSARANAWRGLQTLMWLQDITGVPGFFARSIVPLGEPASRHYGGEWHPSADGKWEWKGDTSSDEADGHFAAYLLYYDLAAKEEEKLAIVQHVRAIMDHIIAHNWYLTDIDGKPTTWGKWNPELFKKTIWGKTARGLNSLEVLSYLNVTSHLTGDPKYSQAKQDLRKEGYGKYIQRVKVTSHPSFANHSDDELADVVYLPFFWTEKDPTLLKSARRGFRRFCKAELPEHNPWTLFLCCQYAGDKKFCDLPSARATLQAIPLDQLSWHMENSQRADVTVSPYRDRGGSVQLTEVLPINERCVLRWNGNPYRPDGCDNGHEEGDGVLFLLPYWLGRYFKLLPADL